MTETAVIAVLAVVIVGLLVSMGSVAAFAWQQWAALRSEKVSREVERIRHERELEVLRQAVEQQHGKSPARSVAIIAPAVSLTPEEVARAIGRSLRDGVEP